MNSKLLVTLIVLALALPMAAQAQRRGGGGLDRDPGGPRGQAGPVERGRGGPPTLETMADRIAASLELRDDQRVLYDEIVTRHATMFEEQRANREQMRELAMAYREAQRNGDTARAEELAAQMREQGGGRRNMLDSFMGEVETILDDGQKQRLAEIRENMGRRGPGGDRPGDMRQMIRELPDQLNMTEDQRAAFEQIMAEQREQMGGMREAWQELRPLMQELREARRAGDEARVAELEAEIEAKRPQRPEPGALFDRIAEILTAEQRAQLEEIRAQMGPRRGARSSGLDLQVVIQSAQRLRLEGEQRQQLRTVLQEAMRMERRERAPEARARVAEAVKQEIVALLTPEQTREFEALIAARSDDGRGRGRGDGAQRPQRGPRGQRDRGEAQPGARPGAEQPGAPAEGGAVEEDLF